MGSSSFVSSDAMSDGQAAIFKALGHPARLRMARALIREKELCVGDLQRIAACDVSTVSRHLSVLRNAGIIDSEKRGLNVWYSLRLTCLPQMLALTATVLTKRSQARQAQWAGLMTQM